MTEILRIIEIIEDPRQQSKVIPTSLCCSDSVACKIAAIFPNVAIANADDRKEIECCAELHKDFLKKYIGACYVIFGIHEKYFESIMEL